jgi:pimeloyl-ACP methyl ester carboxylesterase
MHAEGFLGVPAGRIFYRIAGFGPPLVLIAGGEAGCDMMERLQCELLGRFRVITFDRRGLSRSSHHPEAPLPSIESHAGDLQALVEQVAKEPAHLFGADVGGLIGLELLTQCPACVRSLVVHEAPTSALLGPEDEAKLREAHAEMQVLFRREGLQPAMRISARLDGADPEDREQHVEPPDMTPERERNIAFLMTHDLPAVRQYQLDLPALRTRSGKVIPAAGSSTRGGLLHRCAAALARTLGQPLFELPGGHNGWLMRPVGFGAALGALYEDDRPDEVADWDERPARQADRRPN